MAPVAVAEAAEPTTAPEPELVRLVGLLAESGSRKEARETILAMGAGVVPELVELIDHPEFLIRWEIVNILGYLEDPRALMPLVDRAIHDPNPHVRWRALWALAVLDEEEAVTSELERRMEQSSGNERWQAAVGLSMFGRKQAIPLLVEGTRSEDPWIRFEAINGLGRSFDDRTSTILAALLDHPDTKTRQETAMSLGKIGDEAAVDGLIAALDDAAPEVRLRAALGLKLAGDRRAIPALAARLEQETDASVIEHARETLDSLHAGSKKAKDRERPAVPREAPPSTAGEDLERRLPELIRDLAGTPEQRKRSREAIADAGGNALPYLIERLGDPSFVVRWEIVNLLGNIGDPRGEDALIDRVLHDANHHVRWRALWALAALPEEGAADKLVARLDDESWRVRWQAAIGGSMFERREGIPVLVEGLRNPDAFVRWEAVNALERIHDEGTTAAVLPLLEDPAPDVRHETVLCLSRVADPPALATLVRLIDHSDPEIRWRAAMGLGFAKHRAAIDPLRQRLEREPVELVRDHLSKALENLEDAGD
jgi:HEAT repeat protein